MKAKHIHIFERDFIMAPVTATTIPMWAVCYGGREMDNHFEVMWDLFRSIPSIETEGVSVLDEYYWLNKKDPKLLPLPGHRKAGAGHTPTASLAFPDKAAMEIMKLYLTSDEDLYDKRITDVFDDECSAPTSGSTGALCSLSHNCNSALNEAYMQRFSSSHRWPA